MQAMRSYGPKTFTALDWWPPDGMATEHFGGLKTNTLKRYLISIPDASEKGRARASHLKKEDLEMSMGQKGHSRVFAETARVLRPKCPFIVVREKYEALPGTAADLFEELVADRREDADLGLVGSVLFKRIDRSPQRKVRRRAA